MNATQKDLNELLSVISDLAEQATTVNDVGIEHSGNKIVLPIVNGKQMSYKEAIEWMKRKEKEEEQKVGVHYPIPCSPLDGAYAFHRALSQKYGWTHQIPTPGFFGDKPPAMIGVNISVTEKVDVPYGRIQIPGITGFLSTGMYADPKPMFVIGGEICKKHTTEVNEIYQLTLKFLKEKSIYKGKAIKVSFAHEREDDYCSDDFDPIEHCPHFMDIAGVKEDDLIFGDKVMSDLQIGLFTPIEQSEACRKFGVPLKRGILLHGPYGTGKSLTATITALKAVKNGWTFVYLDSVLDLKKALDFAAQYAPAVVFAEDIDRSVTGDRSDNMDQILNTLDGIDTKGYEIITVLTTNHVDQINPALLRMGRLDTLVEVLPPDSNAAQRLVQLYARGLLAKDTNLETLGNALAGRIPAFIREVTERAKIAAIGRTKGGNIKGSVLEADLLAAAHAMETHAKMLEPKESGKKRQPELLLRVPAEYEDADDLLSQFGHNKAA